MGSRIHMKNLIGRGTNCVLWGRKKEKMRPRILWHMTGMVSAGIHSHREGSETDSTKNSFPRGPLSEITMVAFSLFMNAFCLPT